MKNLGLFSACTGSESGTRPVASPHISALQTTISRASKGLSPSQRGMTEFVCSLFEVPM